MNNLQESSVCFASQLHRENMSTLLIEDLTKYG